MNKIVIVTGASRGIGKEIAKELAIKGYIVVANYNKSENQIKELQKELLERNKTYIGEDTTDIALEDLEKEIKKGAKKNVQKEKKNTTRRNTK